MADRSDRYGFLGREFLTWLWYATDANNGLIDVPDLGHVRVEFGQRLTLESVGNVREGSTVNADAPSQTEEARTALRVGKKVSRARLLIDVSGGAEGIERHFEVALDAETLTFSGVKLPTLMATDEAMRLEERLRLMDELENLVDTLYTQFVSTRRDESAWGPVREAIRAWVQETGA